MKITILAVGKCKERYWLDAIREYEKRLSRYCRLELLEVADEKTPDGAGENLNRQILDKEGKRLLAKIAEDDFVITLEIQGKMPDSVELSQRLEQWGVQGKSSLVFLIGGSLGLSEEVRKRSNYALSFSRLTFPHQMMRVILLEQIYRAYRIMNGEPYHK